MERYIRRTPFGYVSEVGLARPADKSKIIYSDSDNDGLWTSMYGAGECFAYGATKDAAAKNRAKRAFEVLRSGKRSRRAVRTARLKATWCGHPPR